MRSLVSVVWVSLLAGCLAPKHVRPEAPIAESWPVEAQGEGDAAAIGWRTYFTDPRVQSLIATALEQNRDLRVATLNVERARALYQVRLSDHLPNVSADASMTASRQVFGPGLAAEGTVFRAGLTMPAYELDLFGRVRYQSVSGFRQYLATEEGARAATISLVSNVAAAWLAERSLAEQRDLAERVRASREASFGLIEQRHEAGVANELELMQARSLVASARANEASAERLHNQAIQALTLLVGGPIDAAGTGSLDGAGIVADLPAGTPSDLLDQRPDIRAAEQRLRAANADIGAARAAFFPRISLTASLGTASSELTGLFGPEAGVWSFVPALTQPIFGIARNIAAHKVAKVDQRIAVAEYEKSIQTGFREVADALVARGPLDAQVAALQDLRDAEARRLELADQRYAEGLASFLERLDAERSLFEAERALIGARQARLTNAVELYAALGGGLTE